MTVEELAKRLKPYLYYPMFRDDDLEWKDQRALEVAKKVMEVKTDEEN